VTGAGMGEPPVARLNAEDRLNAIKRVASGRMFDLGTNLSRDMPQGSSDTFSPFRLSWHRLPVSLVSPDTAPAFDSSMDCISGSPHLGSHVDGLAHIQCHGHVFGGHAVRDIYSDFGWTENGVERLPPIVAGGVLLDVAAAKGVDQLPDDFEIGPADLEESAARQQTPIRVGDVVLVRTGKIAEFRAGSESYFGEQPGVGVDGSLWLHRQGMVALGTDTSGAEPLPLRDPHRTTHRALLVERGVLIFEILDLDELAAARVYEFLFIALPLKVVGATGSWVRPIALA
jgi:kynurenine formamidase